MEVGHDHGISDPITAAALAVAHGVFGEERVGQVDSLELRSVVGLVNTPAGKGALVIRHEIVSAAGQGFLVIERSVWRPQGAARRQYFLDTGPADIHAKRRADIVGKEPACRIRDERGRRDPAPR